MEGVRRQGEDSPVVESVADLLLLCELGPVLPSLLSEAGEPLLYFFTNSMALCRDTEVTENQE